jgi:predicted peptidase
MRSTTPPPLARSLVTGLLIAGLSMLPACARQSRWAAEEPAVVQATTTPTSAHGFVFDEVGAGGATLKYVAYVPRGYTPDRAWPLVVFLHGSGECGTDGQKQVAQGIGTNILWHADRWPCVVLFPQKPLVDEPWERYDAPVMAMVAEAQRRWRIDPDRVALTGLSQGGHGAWALGSMHPGVWSAVVPICGYAEPLDAPTIAAGLRGVPVWALHGGSDDVVPPSQTETIAAALRAAGAEPRVTIYPGVNHGSWNKAYDEAEMPGFLIQSRRGPPPAARPGT